jgi:hypothetical protein
LQLLSGATFLGAIFCLIAFLFKGLSGFIVFFSVGELLIFATQVFLRITCWITFVYLLKCSPAFLFVWKLHAIGFVLDFLLRLVHTFHFMDEFTDKSLTPCMNRLHKIADSPKKSV